MILFMMLLVLSLTVSGCSDKEETITITDDEGEEIDVTYTEGSDDETCPIGSTITMTDPNSGESITMEVVGTETVEGIEMCHTVGIMNIPDEEVARMEMFTPVDENDESFIMTYYDKDDKVLYEMKLMDGKMTITDENGETIEMNMDNEE